MKNISLPINNFTETALLCVANDIIQCVDEKKAALLVRLDLSAVFDTVDHNVLVDPCLSDCELRTLLCLGSDRIGLTEVRGFRLMGVFQDYVVALGSPTGIGIGSMFVNILRTYL